MQVTVIALPYAPHQLEHQSAMARGLRAIGIEPVLSRAGAGTKHVALWGWRKGAAMRQRGHECLVMERGYLGDRFKWTSLAWNGLNGRATFPARPVDARRFHAHFSMQPWKHDGDYALILGQVPGDASLQGINLMPHYTRWAAQLARAYGIPVHFRAHPRALEKGHHQHVTGTTTSTGTLQEALARARLAVCFNSNAAVDAVLAGVPTVTMDKGSMAWEVTSHEIGRLVRPDRDAWAAQLACRQWTLDEIASGEPLRALFEMEAVHG